MTRRKWTLCGVAACFAVAAAVGLRAWADAPAAADQLAAREDGPPRDGRRPPPDDRGPPRDGGTRGEGRRARDDGPRDRDDGPPPRGRGPDGFHGPRDGDPDGTQPSGPLPRPELGMLLPPFARDHLKLTEEQKKQL